MNKEIRIGVIVVLFALFTFSSLNVHAELYNRGTDRLGNQLIYDSDLNITWYDYTKSAANWTTQMNWANDLDIDFGGLHYTDWRLPIQLDAPWVYGYDGTTTAGYNMTSSDMSHLYYAELGNLGYYDTSGNPQAGWGLINTGDFLNLTANYYWSGTECAKSLDNACYFGLIDGHQTNHNKGADYFALAVRTGDVAIVPEPISSILFVTGGTLLAGRRYFKRKKKA